MADTCERCRLDIPIKNERYCKPCRKIVIQEMKDAGYLRGVYSRVGCRAGTTEDIHQTKRGDENPWQSNAIKDMENRCD